MTPSSTSTWLSECLSRVRGARVGVCGDFCLDAYWQIDQDESEVSIETGLPVRRVRQQRYSLGGAGNIAANLAALGVNAVHTAGLIGDDLFGRQMLELMQAQGVRTDGMLRIQRDWQTLVYGKPCLGSRELHRLDFGAFNRIADLTMDRLAEALDRMAAWCDVIVLNQQVPMGVSPPPMVERVNRVIARQSRCRFIVDSRHRGELYRGAMLKMNAHEAARMCGQESSAAGDGDAARRLAAEIHRRNRLAVFITQGERGIIVADSTGLHEQPVTRVEGPIDPVGAGDTVVAAIAAVLAGGGDAVTAARLANVAAGVTIRKIGITGTASPQEIRQAAAQVGQA